MTTNPISLAPSILPSVREASVQAVAPVSEEPAVEKAAATMLTLEQAKERLRTIKGPAKFLHASRVDLLQVSLFAKIHVLKKARTGDPLDSIISESLTLFSEWHAYYYEPSEAKRLLAKLTFTRLKDLVEKIFVLNKNKQTLDELERDFEVLRHLSQNRAFLDDSLKPLSDDIEETFNQESAQLFEDALTMCSYAVQQLKHYVQTEMRPAFDAALKTLKKRPELELLHRLVKSYCSDLNGLYDDKIPLFIEELQRNPSYKEWRTAINGLVFLDRAYLYYASTATIEFVQFYAHWKKNLPSTLPKEQIDKFLSKLEIHETLIKKQLIAHPNPKISALIEMWPKILERHNTLWFDTRRIPLLFMEQGKKNADLLFTQLQLSELVGPLIAKNFPNLQFTGIHHADLLVRWSLNVLESLPDDSKGAVDRALKNLVIAIGTVEYYSHQEDRAKLEAEIEKLLRYFNNFVAAIEKFVPKDFSTFLNCFYGFSSGNTFLRNIPLSCNFSLLAQPIVASSFDQPLLSAADVAFIKGQVVRQINQLEGIVELFPMLKETVLKLQQERIEDPQFPKAFWKKFYTFANLLESGIRLFLRATVEMKRRFDSPTSSLVAELKSWRELQKQHLDPEAAGIFGQLLTIVGLLTGDQEKRVIELSETITHHLALSAFLARPFLRFIQISDLLAEKESVKKREKQKREIVVKPVKEEPEPPLQLTEDLAPPFPALHILQKGHPIPFEEEELFAHHRRKEKMANSLQNHFYLLALLEEEERAPFLKSLFRGDTDAFRLLEMTEKLALAYLPIPESQQMQHLHDGLSLAKVLSNEEPLFTKEEFQPAFASQEQVLKVDYWFGDERTTKIEGIVAQCQEIWFHLAKRPTSNLSEDAFGFISQMDSFVYRQRLQQNGYTIPNDLPPLKEQLLAFEQVGPQSEAVKRILTLARRLDEHRGKCHIFPILFANRHAEIQIGFLTTVLKSCLSREELFAPSERRPLIHSHNVLDLWQALKGDKATGAKLSPFVGDPRYPYPNKSAISNDLVISFELSKLQECVQTGFWNKETKALFKKHCSEATVEKKLAEHLDQIEMKSRFALQLCLEIIKR